MLKALDLRDGAARGEGGVRGYQLVAIDDRRQIGVVGDVVERRQDRREEGHDDQLGDRQPAADRRYRDRREAERLTEVGGDHDRSPTESVDPCPGDEADRDAADDLECPDGRDLSRPRAKDEDRRERQRRPRHERAEDRDGCGAEDPDEGRVAPDRAGHPGSIGAGPSSGGVRRDPSGTLRSPRCVRTRAPPGARGARRLASRSSTPRSPTRTVFDSLSERLRKTLGNLTGRGRISEADVDAAMREIRLALLEADVNFKVVKDFVARVREKAIGARGPREPDRRPAGREDRPRRAGRAAGERAIGRSTCQGNPAVVAIVGLQGSGKTTSTAKLARHLVKQGRRPLLVAADPYRPAAADQLETLGRALDIPVHRAPAGHAGRRHRPGRRSRRHAARSATSSSSTPPAGSRSTRR